jgi:hypothetical protein
VVKALISLDKSLQLDYTKAWDEISHHVAKQIIPIINTMISEKIKYNTAELQYILRQLHRHQRDNWKLQQDPEKLKLDKKRKGTNARRSDVSEFFISISVHQFLFKFILSIRKKREGKEEFNICLM